jgi:hypothetical protein
MVIYYQSKYVIVSWEEEAECVHTEWHGFASKHNLKSGLIKAVELAKEKKATRWLGDLRDMHVYDLKDQEWIIKELVPRMHLIGIKRMAFIKPILPVTRMSINRMIRACDPKGKLSAVFEDLPSAYEWLRAIPPRSEGLYKL